MAYENWTCYIQHCYVQHREKSDLSMARQHQKSPPLTIWYIHPPHQGHTKVPVMARNDKLTWLLFHVNLPPPLLL